METVVSALSGRQLPEDPLWITLDILVQWQKSYQNWPSYREIARTLDVITKKPVPTSASTIQTYVNTLYKLRYLTKKDGHWMLNETVIR